MGFQRGRAPYGIVPINMSRQIHRNHNFILGLMSSIKAQRVSADTLLDVQTGCWVYKQVLSGGHDVSYFVQHGSK